MKETIETEQFVTETRTKEIPTLRVAIIIFLHTRQLNAIC